MFETTKRKFLFGLGGLFAAPALIKIEGLMRPKVVPPLVVDPKEIARLAVRLRELNEHLAPVELTTGALTKKQLSESLLNLQGRWLVPRAVLDVNPNVVEELIKLTGYRAWKHNYLFDETGAAYTNEYVGGNVQYQRKYARDLPNDLLEVDKPNQLFYQEYGDRIRYDVNSQIATIEEEGTTADARLNVSRPLDDRDCGGPGLVWPQRQDLRHHGRHREGLRRAEEGNAGGRGSQDGPEGRIEEV
jgi:hypothetical protein